MSLIPSDFFGGRRTSVFDPFSLDIWDPFLDLSITPSTALSVPRSDVSREVAQFASVRIDWRETPEAHVFQADLPGMRKDEVRVEVEEGRVLSISGERRREKEEVTDTWHRLERGSGRFSRRFRLPEDVRVDQVKATMENGVLTVVVPKAAAVRPDVKPIPITG
ncbi:17.3 kDa class I heat shock protein-like [Rhodamnia argentea]|uniref:17.3 kDa class I heat shock protein-like n=1 Tax=Rhodamnia argentea TaxID=178133 RepID=A0A8B8PII5_9MYRT|nr:17.3 kDa class I heat shock protein-like [Rhodamnia argentea]